MIREATPDDLAFVMRLVVACHPPSIVDMNMETTEAWAAALLRSDDVIKVIGEHGAAFAFVNRSPWDNREHNCELAHIFSLPDADSPLEALMLLREIDRLRKLRGCQKFFIISTVADLTPFARKMGARPIGSLHVLEGVS